MPQPRARARARDAEILQAAANEAEHLVLARARHDPQLVGLDQLAQAIGIARQAKEIVLLLDQLRRDQVLRTQPSGQLTFGVELLAAHAV